MEYNAEFEQQLFLHLDKEKIQKDEPMSAHTTFRVGGPADYFVVPTETEEIETVIRLCETHAVPYYVCGNGSNLLVGDKGFRGVVIQVFKAMNRIEVKDSVITAQAGASLASVANAALEYGLTGFEFAAGIPGTLGGAVVMNAGAYGGEMKDVIKSAKILTKDGKVLSLLNGELELGYRSSIISKEKHIVLEAELSLAEGDKAEIKEKMDELRGKRISKQPLEYPSAGSTFKRPEGYFAGKLIEDAGLKGFAVGGAQISEKHSGFVINTGNATAADIRELICQVSERVKAQFNVELEPEVKQIGEF